MRISTKEVRDGLHNGKIVWICHYLQEDLDKKPLRNVPPTKCVICDNSETSKNIYYSESHFKKIGRNGLPTKAAISPVDNTGYRTRHGNELYVFDNEAECKSEWVRQVSDVMALVQNKIDTSARYWKGEKEKLRNML